MKKEEARKVIVDCSQSFEANLKNMKYAFVFCRSGGNDVFEASFFSKNYMHLTGVKCQSHIKSSIDFYNRCVNNRLSIDDFAFSADGTTQLKLQVLPSLMRIHENAKMMGEYLDGRVQLHTQKIVGTVHACMGFVKEGDIYVPNTILREDTRNLVAETPHRIVAIFSAPINSPHYRHICYAAKGISIEDVLSSATVQSKLRYAPSREQTRGR